MSFRDSFVVQGLKHLKEVGTVIPCSRFVGDKIAEKIDFDKEGDIVEIGSGTGAITKRILRKMKENQRLICLELNKVFCDRLMEMGDKRLEIHCKPGEEISKVVNGRTNYVISSIPLTLLTKRERESYIRKIKKALVPGSAYIQFQYSLSDLGFLKKHFREVRVSLVPLNILPGFVIYCKNG